MAALLLNGFNDPDLDLYAVLLSLIEFVEDTAPEPPLQLA
jgi:hypothetical protein